MSFERALVKAWYKKNVLLYLLLPLNWFFTFASWIRRRYLQGQYQGRAYPIPVIVVGNISVGGNGKTPFIISLVKALHARHIRVGVVSRGFGGHATDYPTSVVVDSNPSESGDEALLIARSCHCPVVIDPDRSAAVMSLIAEYDVDLILSDDGLQHYRMHRDIEIAVVDVNRGFGTACRLPVGPLRESLRRLHEVDFVVLNGDAELDNAIRLPIHSYWASMAPRGLRKFASTELISHAEWTETKTVYVVAAIANPQRVADTLASMGFYPILVPRNDHQVLSAADLIFENPYPVVITAKDAVKYTDSVPDNLWVLEVDMLLEDDLVEKICHRIKPPVTTA